MPAWPASGLERCPVCPVCGATDHVTWVADLPDRVFRSAPGFWTFRCCTDCRSAFIDPRPTRETISNAYRGYYTHTPITHQSPPTGRIASWRVALRHGYLNRRFGLDLQGPSRFGAILVPIIPGLARRHRQWARLPRPHRGATLLDVGAGAGADVAHFRLLGWDAVGLDLDEAAVAAAQAADIPVTEGEITELVGEARFDAIIMNHSLEHLHAPLVALHATFRLLRTRGMIEIATPNIASVGSRLYKQDWLGLDPPRHLVLLSPGGLSRALEEIGFRHIVFHSPRRSPAWYFHASEALRRGQDWSVGAPLSRRGQVALVAAHVCSTLVPRLAEEILVTARKP